MSHKNKHLIPVVGITGVIGSGKTILAKLFRDNGAFIIDADEVGREVLEKNRSVFTQVVEQFGKDILENETKVSRKKVAEIVFSSDEQVQKLNTIIHPPMIQLIEKRINNAVIDKKYPMIVVDAALIFEACVQDRFDYIITVHASGENILKRLTERKGMSATDIQRRMKSQISQEEKIKKSHYAIENNGTIEEFKRQGGKLFQEVYEDFRKSHI